MSSFRTAIDEVAATGDATINGESRTNVPYMPGDHTDDLQARLRQLNERRNTPISDGASPSSADAAKRKTHRWARWLHVYTSMVALLIVLFFGITGITLNHPDWAFGDATSRDTISGLLAVDPTLDDGAIDWLSVAEEVRADYDIKGSVSDFAATGTEGRILFVNPGYSADLFFDTADASFDLTVEQQGFIAVMNDLHKGRDAGSAWGWVIDVSAGFLVVISLTGLVMQFFLRKRRRSALTTTIVGGIVSIALIWFTIL